jgi:hypothetical protein
VLIELAPQDSFHGIGVDIVTFPVFYYMIVVFFYCKKEPFLLNFKRKGRSPVWLDVSRQLGGHHKPADCIL